jgi:hypothetical protein
MTRAIPRARSQEIFLGLLILLHLAVLFLLVYSVGYMSRRHVYPLVVLALPWSAAGVRECARWASPHLRRWRGSAAFSREGRAAALILGGIVIVLAPKTFYPSRLDQLTQREAGRWIRAVSGGSPAPVLSHMEKVAHYAGALHIPIQKDYRSAVDIGRNFRAGYAAIYREKVNRKVPGFLESIREDEMVRVASFRHTEKGPRIGQRREIHLDVYRILYPPAEEAPGDR